MSYNLRVAATLSGGKDDLSPSCRHFSSVITSTAIGCDMNYKKHYDILIERARLRVKPDGYSERHHIVPRCLGGSNESSNLVYLTAREHYVAHLLLAKEKSGSLWAAVRLMGENLNRKSSRMYESARVKHSQNMSGSCNPSFGKSKHTCGLVERAKRITGKSLFDIHGASKGLEIKNKMKSAQAGVVPVKCMGSYSCHVCGQNIKTSGNLSQHLFKKHSVVYSEIKNIYTEI